MHYLDAIMFVASIWLTLRWYRMLRGMIKTALDMTDGYDDHMKNIFGRFSRHELKEMHFALLLLLTGWLSFTSLYLLVRSGTMCP